MPACNIFPDLNSCGMFGGSCKFNSQTAKCVPDCTDTTKEAACNKRAGCAWTGAGKCYFKCAGIADKQTCAGTGCAWIVDKCVLPCSYLDKCSDNAICAGVPS
jgi:hypothetical protein